MARAAQAAKSGLDSRARPLVGGRGSSLRSVGIFSTTGRSKMEYEKNNEIVLNFRFKATSNPRLSNGVIEFKARLGGVTRDHPAGGASGGQGHALDRLIELDALRTRPPGGDPFSGESRLEARQRALAAKLPRLAPGYEHCTHRRQRAPCYERCAGLVHC